MRRSDRPQALTRAAAQHPRGRLHERHYAAPGSGTIVIARAQCMHSCERYRDQTGLSGSGADREGIGDNGI